VSDLTMYDATTVANIPKTAVIVAGYVGGLYPTYITLQKQFPKATLLSIAVNSSEDAQCLDVEKGDAIIADIPAWYKRQLANKVSRPVIYASVGNMADVLSELASSGISRQNVRLWSAHYANGNHICGPSTCGQVRQDMDGTQWTDNANGISLDQSTLVESFFVLPSVAVTAIAATMDVPPTIQNGSTDKGNPISYVARAQAILNAVFGQQLTIDGNYGAQTELAVKAVQTQAKLTVDGVVGPQTWKVLYLGE
jgi:peptidoglycan hydrolase-like protein with peptidoglycan-binding domain